MKLSDFGRNVYSQFGEDGVIETLFEQLGLQAKVCVEFGANDGISCSNVANLWKHHGWRAVLIESDWDMFTKLKTNIGPKCHPIYRTVTPTGADAIDLIIGQFGATEPALDLMCIDVDGNDYVIWDQMVCRPSVICIEFNPTIPPHLSLHQEYDPISGQGFGTSLAALIELSVQKEYTFIGATYCNAFFVRNDRLVGRRDRPEFLDYERDPQKLFPPSNYTYLISDFTGSATAAGAPLPWGINTPYIGPPVVGAQTYSITDDVEQTMRAYKKKYGHVVWWPHEDMPNVANPDFMGAIPGGKMEPTSARNLLRKYLFAGVAPICIGVAHVALSQVEWVFGMAAAYGYNYRLSGGVIALLRSDQ